MTMPTSVDSPPFSALRALHRSVLDAALAVARADTERTRTQRDAVTAFMVRVASAGILYLSQIVLARWMGGYEYGIYVFVWTWVLVLGGLSHLGFNTVVIRLIPEYTENDSPSLLRGLLFGSQVFAVASSTAVMALGMIVLYAYGDDLDNVYVLPAYLALVCVPMFALTDVQDGIGRGSAWMMLALVPPYILRPILVLLAMGIAYGVGLPMEASTAAGAAVIATWGAAVAQTLLIQRRIEREIPSGKRVYSFKSWLTTSLPLIVITGCEILLQNTDILVISRYLGPEDVGIYFAAAKTMSLIMFVHFAVGSAVANRFATFYTRGDKNALRAFVKDAVNWTFWPSLAAAAFILALGKPLLWLFGPQFTSGYPVMFILVLGFLFRSAMGPAEYVLNMLGEQRACAINLTIAAAVNIVLNFVAVPAFGLIGAAMATAFSLVLVAALNYAAARHRLGLDIAIWRNLPWS